MQLGKLTILGDSAQTSKGYFQIASGNATTDRPGTPVNSMLRYNNVGNYFEGYQNSAWASFVTNVGLSLPSIFTTSGSPVTSTGTLTATLASAAANTVFAAPNGTNGLPTFRALVNSDLPATINVQTAITMPTMTAGDSSTNGATTAFVGSAITTALLSVYVFKGTIDITATPPVSPKTGDTYRVTTGGTPNAGYTFTPAQTRCDVGDHITYNGSTWDRYADVNPAVTAGAGITVTPTGDTSYAVAITNSITAGSAGSASTVPAISYSAQGLITSASSVSIAISDSAVTWSSRAQNLVFASPNGTSGAPTFRSIVAADIATTGGTAYQILGVNSAGTAMEYKTISAGTGISLTPGTGTLQIANTGVTNVGLALPSIFTTSGSPVTSTGTLTATLASAAANTVFAAPNGTNGLPTFRSLVSADIPALAYVTTVGLSLPNIFTVTGSPVTSAGTLTASMATQAQSTFLAAPSTTTGAPTFRVIVAADLPASAGKTYRTSFTNASLTAGVLTVTHNLSQQYVMCRVMDNNNKVVDPDDVICISTSQLTIDVTSWGTLTGTWNTVIIG